MRKKENESERDYIFKKAKYIIIIYTVLYNS